MMPYEDYSTHRNDNFNDITDESTKAFTELYQQKMGLVSAEEVLDDDPTRRPLSEEEMKLEDHDIMPDYEISERLGRGGCAIVYEGWRKSDRFHVAIKQLAIPATIDEEEEHIARRRFYREAKLIMSLKEPHIVQCVDYGVMNEGQPCMVLEFIKGRELGDYLQDPEQYKSESEQYLSIEKAVSIVIQVLQGLAVSHEKTIIHRDIKPGNIMILDDSPADAPVVKVLDFGIATVIDSVDNSSTLMTQQGNIRGTPSYMAPELFTGAARASVESDLYAVGLVLLECLTNKIAFQGPSFMQVAYMQVNEPAEIPSYIPDCLAGIIRKACAKKKDDRYHSAEDMISDLRANLEPALREYPRCLARYRNQKEPSALMLFWMAHKKHMLFAGLGLVAVCVVVGLSALLFFSNFRTTVENVDNPETQAALEAANAANEQLSAEARAAQETQKRERLQMTRDLVHEKIRSSWENSLIIMSVTAQRAAQQQAQKPSSAAARVIESQRAKSGQRNAAASGTQDGQPEKSSGTKNTSSDKSKKSKKNSSSDKSRRDTMRLPTGFL